LSFEPTIFGSPISIQGTADTNNLGSGKGLLPRDQLWMIRKPLDGFCDEPARTCYPVALDEIPDSGRIFLRRLVVWNFDGFSHAVLAPSVAGP